MTSPCLESWKLYVNITTVTQEVFLISKVHPAELGYRIWSGSVCMDWAAVSVYKCLLDIYGVATLVKMTYCIL